LTEPDAVKPSTSKMAARFIQLEERIIEMQESEARVSARLRTLEKSDKNQQAILICFFCIIAAILILNRQNFSDELNKTSEVFLSSAMVAATSLLIVNRVTTASPP